MKTVDVDIAIVSRPSDGKVLICRRKEDTAFAGYWEFPGGKRNPGETADQCVTRELLEEVAIEVQIVQRLDVVEHDYPTGRIRLHPHLCRHTAGEPQLLGCQEAIWVDPQALRQYRFPPANDDLIARAITRLESLGQPAADQS